MSIKSELEKLVKETLKSESTNPNWFNGFEIIVTGNIVQIEKNGIKSKQGFLYDKNAIKNDFVISNCMSIID